MPDPVTSREPRCVTPPSSGAVLLAGLATLARRAGAQPALPGAVLERPEAGIDPARLAAYRALCGFAEEQGVPPSYPHLLAFPLHLRLMMLPDFPYPMAGLVHVANRIVQHAAIGAGDRLRVRAWFGGFRRHPRGQAFTIRAAVAKAGTTVWESESAYLRVGARSTLGEALSLTAGDDPAATPVREETVPRAVAPRYARISGDRNPIHLSWIGARLFGFPRPIAHGMWTKARMLAFALPAGPIECATIEAVFRAPILLGDRAAFCLDRTRGTTRFAVRGAGGARLHLAGRLRLAAEPFGEPQC